MPYKDKEKANAASVRYHSTPYARARAKAWRDTPERKRIAKNALLMKSYGITLETYNILFQKQLGCCAICNKHQSILYRSLDVDHDHETNKVRGLLCGTCNTHLGIYEKGLSKFEAYLKGDIK